MDSIRKTVFGISAGWDYSDHQQSTSFYRYGSWRPDGELNRSKPHVEAVGNLVLVASTLDTYPIFPCNMPVVNAKGQGSVIKVCDGIQPRG